VSTSNLVYEYAETACISTYVLRFSAVFVSGMDVNCVSWVAQTVRDRIPVGTRFSTRPDRPWGPPILLQSGYRVFPGGMMQSGRAADHSPPSIGAVLEE